MKKAWEHSVLIDAPVDQVFTQVADFNRHVDWDHFTRKVELSKSGDARGVGAEWKVYEKLGLFSLGESRPEPKNLTGLAKRLVREVSPNQRVAWHTHPIPNVGISADISYDFASEGNKTRVTFTSVVAVPGMMETVGRLVLRNLDTRQHNQWQEAVERLKEVAEEAHARQLLTAGV